MRKSADCRISPTGASPYGFSPVSETRHLCNLHTHAATYLPCFRGVSSALTDLISPSMLCILIRSLKDSRSSQLGTLAAASACSCQNVWQQQQQVQQSRNKLTLPERSRDAQAGNCMQICFKCHLRWRRGAPNWKSHWASRAEAEKKRRRRTEKAKLRAWTAEASDYYVSPEDIAARNNGDAQASAAVCQLHTANSS